MLVLRRPVHVMIAMPAMMMLCLAACITGSNDRKASEVVERSFSIADSSIVMVDGFVGDVTVRPGAAGAVRIVATKRADTEAGLAEIGLTMTTPDTGAYVKATGPSQAHGHAVDFEITVPAGIVLRIAIGVGEFDVDAPANVIIALTTGVGNIRYDGRPISACKFATGVGNIRLELPADIGITLAATTGVGDVDVEFPVVGTVTKRSVVGTIGSGTEAEVVATTDVGNVDVERK